MDTQDQAGIHSRISEHAQDIASLAEEVVDRQIKLHLIGVALGLLGLLDRYAHKSEAPNRLV